MIDISKNITKSIIKADEVELAADITEFTIDQILEDGILKEIPWVGWIFKAKLVYTSITDRILFAKIARFLLKQNSIKLKYKTNFLNNLKKNPSQKSKIGTTLLLILDKINDLNKVDILASVFEHFLSKDITFSDFTRIAHAIEQAHIDDILSLQDNPNYENLLNCGLSSLKTKFDVTPTLDSIEINIPLKLSKIGIILKLILKKELKKENKRMKEQIKLMESIFWKNGDDA
jgi:hypothetical protein